MNEDFTKKFNIDISKISESFKNINLENYKMPQINMPTFPDLPDIEIPPNPVYETNELLNKQILLLQQQNEAIKSQLNITEEQKCFFEQQAKESLKEAKKSRIFGWVSFGVGTFIGVAGVVVAIIAIFLSR